MNAKKYRHRIFIIAGVFLLSGCYRSFVESNLNLGRTTLVENHGQSPLPTAKPTSDDRTDTLTDYLIGGASDLASIQTLGSRSYREIYQTFSQLTGVPYRTGNGASSHFYLNEPRTNDLVSLSAPAVLNVVRLASTFCTDMVIANGALKISYFPGYDTVKKALSEFSVQKQRAAVIAMGTAFYGGYVPAEKEIELLLGLISDFPPAPQSNFNSVAIALCTVMLSSPRTLIY